MKKERECFYCELPFNKLTVRTWDHFYPKSKFKGLTYSRVPCCRGCNSFKRALPPAQFLEKLEVIRENVKTLINIKGGLYDI